MYKFIIATLLCGALIGCSEHSNNKDNRNSDNVKYMVATEKAEPVPVKKNESHLTQCNRDLESLRTVSLGEYRRYLAEYDGLMKSSAGFIAVKDDVSPEVADLARPRFQFALVNLCYRIKDAVAQTLISQAGGR